MTAEQSSRAAHRYIAALMAAWGVVLAGAAGRVDAAPPDWTVAVMTYHDGAGGLAPSSRFSGVLLDADYVLTSRGAIEQGHGDLASGFDAQQPSYVLVVVQSGAKQLKLPAKVIQLAPGAPLAALQLDPSRRAEVSSMIPEAPALAPPQHQGMLRAFGVASPWGLLPEQIGPHAIPAPAAVSLEFHPASAGATMLTPLMYPLPSQFEGGGAWDEQGRLAGVIVHDSHRWNISDPSAIVAQLKLRPKQAVPPGGAAPAVASNIPGAMAQEMSPSLNELAQMLREAGLTLQLPPGLLDYVGQDQADLVMAYIAGGRFDKAEEILNEIEPLASGKLAEQLNYRRALVLLLRGEYAAAKERAAATLAANDPRVRGRGRILYRVLENQPSGTYADRPLKEPQVLIEALLAEMAKLERQVQAAFDAARAQQLVSKSSYDVLMQKLGQIAQAIEQNQDQWPGYFDRLAEQVKLFRETTVRNEYARATEEMQTLHARYQAELSQAERKQGPGWSKAGHWPPVRVGAANVIADRYNELLAHRGELEQQLSEPERRPLPPELAEPLKRLELARQADLR